MCFAFYARLPVTTFWCRWLIRAAPAKGNLPFNSEFDPAFLLECAAQADARQIACAADAVFLDPSRQVQQRRLRAVDEYSSEDQIPPDCEVEFVSAAGQCRECVLYFGDLATAGRKAVLPGDRTAWRRQAVPCTPRDDRRLSVRSGPCRGSISSSRSALPPLGAWKLDPQIAYVSADEPVDTPFARVYRVVDWQPFHLKRLRKRLLDGNMFPAVIKRRRFPLEPDELIRLLKIGDGKIPVTAIATRIDKKPVVAVCKQVVFSAH